MMRTCVGITDESERIVWSDGTGRAACGAEHVHGPHTYDAREDAAELARRLLVASEHTADDMAEHDDYARTDAELARMAERAADAEHGTPCLVCGAPVNSNGAGHDDGCMADIADCPSCGAGADAGRCERCARYGTHGGPCRHAHLEHRCMRT